MQALFTRLGYHATAANTSSTSPQVDEVLAPESNDAVEVAEPIANQPSVANTSQVYYVADMSCASCVAKIEGAFSQLDNIEARVNLADKQLQVFGDISHKEVLKRLTNAGYQASVVTDAKASAAAKIETDKHEYKTRIKQAVLGLGLGLPMMAWGLLGGDMMINSTSQQVGWGLMGLLTLLLMVTCGRHFYQGMWRALKVGSSNMDTLIALGTASAWGYSMLVVLMPQWFPADTRHVYFEASAMIIGLINLGHALELRARGKTSEAVQKLLGMQSSKAIRIGTNGDEEVEISELQLGDKLRLKPGSRVALDGVVEVGHSLLDESMLTGEPVPVAKQVGDELSAGTVNNGNGSLVYRVIAQMQDTKLAKIISLVQQAQTSKMPIGRLTDKISAYFVPTVVIIALLASLTWLLVGPAPQLSHALVVLTSVLIIACPCALGLATPMSIMVSVGRAAQLGVLVKNGEALQTASKVTCVVLDKTGTVTQGKPSVTDTLVLQDSLSEATLLTALASLEQHSEHPLASAIVQYCKAQQVALIEPDDFSNHQGMGITGTVANSQWALGNKALLAKLNVVINRDVERTMQQWANEAKTPIFVVQNKQLVAAIAISDPIKDEAIEVVAQLTDMGLKVVMLTGDNPQTAQAVATQVGIKHVIAEVLPDQKQAHVIKLQNQGEIVAMVGDGINDAPALVSANVGVAMGTGTDVAIESADLTLISGHLTSLPQALSLAKATINNIKQNLFGAFIYNTLGIPVAAGLLYPLTGTLLSPIVAGAAMALSSLTVVTNANRLRSKKL
ncbi:heavy metal translocating P-type ATPase [Shewanella marina]|uniref:heavy metal translocating P-type ATPase n=1 Tax=Shewanella marina TaxID=487319 RepID=UPI00357105C4